MVPAVTLHAGAECFFHEGVKGRNAMTFEIPKKGDPVRVIQTEHKEQLSRYANTLRESAIDPLKTERERVMEALNAPREAALAAFKRATGVFDQQSFQRLQEDLHKRFSAAIDVDVRAGIRSLDNWDRDRVLEALGCKTPSMEGLQAARTTALRDLVFEREHWRAVCGAINSPFADGYLDYAVTLRELEQKALLERFSGFTRPDEYLQSTLGAAYAGLNKAFLSTLGAGGLAGHALADQFAWLRGAGVSADGLAGVSSVLGSARALQSPAWAGQSLKDILGAEPVDWEVVDEPGEYEAGRWYEPPALPIHAPVHPQDQGLARENQALREENAELRGRLAEAQERQEQMAIAVHERLDQVIQNLTSRALPAPKRERKQPRHTFTREFMDLTVRRAACVSGWRWTLPDKEILQLTYEAACADNNGSAEGVVKAIAFHLAVSVKTVNKLRSEWQSTPLAKRRQVHRVK